MEKKIELNEAFYGTTTVGSSSVYCLPTIHLPPCFTLDKPCIMGDFACPKDTPCLDTPCTDTPCSDSPCSDSPCSDSAPVYTAPTFTISNITESGCDVNVRPGSGYTRYRVFARLTSDPDDKSYDWTFNTSSAFTATMDSLLPKTSYTVNVCGVIGNVSDKWAGAKTFTTSVKYAPFDWTYAGRDPSTNSRIAGTTKQSGLVICITAGEWNALVDAVNQRKGTSISHVSRGAAANSVAVIRPVANALGVAIPSEFTAAFFNQLRTAVNQIQ